MSDSFHVTRRNFKHCSKSELSEQARDPKSDLSQWAEKRATKREVIERRKEHRRNLNVPVIHAGDQED